MEERNTTGALKKTNTDSHTEENQITLTNIIHGLFEIEIHVCS